LLMRFYYCVVVVLLGINGVCISSLRAQNYTHFEYFLDTNDAGIGLNNLLSYKPGKVEKVDFAVGTTPGQHVLSVRFKSSNGSWSAVTTSVVDYYPPVNGLSGVTSFFIVPDSYLDDNNLLVSGEHFIEPDPGVGSGSGFSFSPATSLFNYNIANIAPGALATNVGYEIGTRFKDSRGNWGQADYASFFVYDFPSVTNTLIGAGEYFLGNDPGPGSGTFFTFNPANPTGAQVINTTALLPSMLQAGSHQLGVRLLDKNNKWGSSAYAQFFLFNTPLSFTNNKIIKGEYFVVGDADPGIGQGTAFSISPSAIQFSDFVVSNIALPTNLPFGSHQLAVRVMDEVGTWSHTVYSNFFNQSVFFITNKAITQMEYFIDTDPGVGNAIQVEFDGNSFGGSPQLTTGPITAPFGAHQLGVRVKDEAGRWGHPQYSAFYVMPTASLAENKKITAMQVFFGSDPGIGASQTVTIPLANPQTQVVDRPVNIDILPFNLEKGEAGMNKTHVVGIRVKDEANAWSQASAAQFEINDQEVEVNVKVVSPNNGEIFYTGQVLPIHWSYHPSIVNKSLDIYYSLNGIDWFLIASDQTTGSFNWTIPTNMASSLNCRIRIRQDAGEGSTPYFDESDNFFQIRRFGTELTSPAPNTTFFWWQSVPFGWMNNGLPADATVKIDMTLSGSNVTQTINPAAIPVNDLQYTSWSVPSGTAEGAYEFSIYPDEQPQNGQTIVLNLKKPKISVNSLASEYYHGTTLPIVWSTAGVPANALVSISVLNPATDLYESLATVVNSGLYNWVIPVTGTFTGTSRIKLTWAEHVEITVLSSPFVMKEAYLSFVNPSGSGAVVYQHDQYNFQWDSRGVGSGTVTLQYRLQGSNEIWNTIDASLPVIGSKVWTVGNDTGAGSYEVRIMTGGFQDLATIQVKQPFIVVNTPLGTHQGSIGLQWTSDLPANATINLFHEYAGIRSSIATAISNTGNYQWQSFNLPPGDYKVIAQWAAHPLVESVSGIFDVLTPSIVIDTPLMNSSYNPGNTVNLAWTGLGIANQVKLETSTNNLLWVDRLSNLPGTGSSSYVLPTDLELGTTFYFRLSWQAGYGTVYTSVRSIHIGNPILTIASIPTLYTANVHSVSWDAAGISDTEDVSLEIKSTENNGTWQSIQGPTLVKATAKNFTWNIPSDLAAGWYQIRVRLITDTSVESISIPFSIAHPSVSLITPNGNNQIYYLGSNVSVSWVSSGMPGATYSLDYTSNYTTDAGSTWVEVAGGVTGNSLTWQVPISLTPSANVRMRVRSSTNSSDVSNSSFQVKLPVITLTNPKDIEVDRFSVWASGQSRRVSWLTEGFTGTVSIDYTTDLGSTAPVWNTLASSVPASALEKVVTVPHVSASTDVKLRVVSEAFQEYVSSAVNIKFQPALAGDTDVNPLVVAFDNPWLPDHIDFEDTKSSTTFSHNYTGTSHLATHDIYYMFTVPSACTDAISIKLVNTSYGYSRIFLLDKNRNYITHSDGQFPVIERTGAGLQAGENYYIVVQGGQDPFSYTLRVDRVEHEVKLGADQETCPGQVVALTSNVTGDEYSWLVVNPPATGSIKAGDETLSTAHVTGPGTFKLHVTKNQCTKSDEVAVLINNKTIGVFSVNLPGNGAINSRMPLAFTWGSAVNATNYDFFIWPSGQDEPAVDDTPNSPGVSNLTSLLTTVTQGLQYNQSYKWKVRARNSCYRAFSSQVNTISMAQVPDLVTTIKPLTNKDDKDTTIAVTNAIKIRWTVTNASTITTTQNFSWRDKIYFSTDNLLSSDDRLLRDIANSKSLKKNGETPFFYDAESTFSIPENILTGAYFVIVTSTGLEESNYVNNVAVSVKKVNVSGRPRPNLQVADLSVSKTTLVAGQEFNVSFKVKNVGDAMVEPVFFDGIYLKNGNAPGILLTEIRNFKTSNTSGGATFFYNDLRPGEEYTVTKSVKIPVGIIGNYAILAKSDIYGNVEESAEGDNEAVFSGLTIAAPSLPDLFPVSFLGLAQKVAAGFYYNCQWVVENKGIAAPELNSGWVDKVYLSKESVFDESKAQLIGQSYTEISGGSVFGPGGSITVEEPLFVPLAIPDGFYYVFVKLNDDGRLAESNMPNNIFRSGETIEIVRGSNPPSGLACDNFFDACEIAISQNGFGYDTKNISFDLTSATTEPGEQFSTSIHQKHGKSVWYKFTIPIQRMVEIAIPEEDNAPHLGITSIGVTVFRAPSIPGLPKVSYPGGTGSDLADFTQLTKFGVTGNYCLPAGTYYVRFSAREYVANQRIFGSIIFRTAAEHTQSTYAYDRAIHAYQFPTLNKQWQTVTFDVGCLSLDNEEEVFVSLKNTNPVANYRDYTQTAWFTFRTGQYADAVRILLSGIKTFSDEYKVGVKVYKGNVRTEPINALVLIDSAKFEYRALPNEQLPRLDYLCNVVPDGTYSIQLFFYKYASSRFTLQIRDLGTQLTAGVSPSNPVQLGVLDSDFSLGEANFDGYTKPPGKKTSYQNNFACNAYMRDNQACGYSPTNGILLYDGIKFNLSQWYTFELDRVSNVLIASRSPNIKQAILFRGDVKKVCDGTGITTLLGSSKKGQLATPVISNYGFEEQFTFDRKCLEPGVYSLQVLGRADSLDILGILSNLGLQNFVEFFVQRQQPSNKFNLSSLEAIDNVGAFGVSRNNLQVLAEVDTFGCAVTPLPVDVCSGNFHGAIYRQFEVTEEGSMRISDTFSNKLYRGAITQVPTTSRFVIGEAMAPCSGTATYCLSVGKYTLVSFGGFAQVGRVSQPTFKFNAYRNSNFKTPATSEQIGDITASLNSGGGTGVVTSQAALITCESHLFTIGNFDNCDSQYDKMFFREFELTEAMPVTITGSNHYHDVLRPPAVRLLKGSAREGLSTLQRLDPEYSYNNDPDCKFGSGFESPRWISNTCKPLPPGKYTVVYYASGGSYDGMGNGRYTSSSAGNFSSITIRKTTRNLVSQFNRPTAASDEGRIEWSRKPSTASAYPFNARVYQFQKEQFTCISDAADLANIQPFPSGYSRVVYYVFRLNKASFFRISLGSISGAFGGFTTDLKAWLYPFDVRYDYPRLSQSDPIGSTRSDVPGNQLEFCDLSPGVYSLVVFVPDGDAFNGMSVQPSVYLERPQPTLYDTPLKAYDYRVVPGDGRTWYGNPYDTHPSGNPVLPPTSDFISCKTGGLVDPTGVSQDDEIIPPLAVDEPSLYCYVNSSSYKAQYPVGVNKVHRNGRKTLWYSFQIQGGGDVIVGVHNRTPERGGINFSEGNTSLDEELDGSGLQYSYSVYEYTPNANILSQHPQAHSYSLSDLAKFNLLQGTDASLKFKTWNVRRDPWGFCIPSSQLVRWAIDPCEGNAVKRYFVVVENHESIDINSQVEVSVRHFKNVDKHPANDLKVNSYTIKSSSSATVLGEGIYQGESSTFNCATGDSDDQTSCGGKTIWWKFDSKEAGKVRINYDIQLLQNGARPVYETRFNDPLRADIDRDPSNEEVVLYWEKIDPKTNQKYLRKIPLQRKTFNGSNWGEGCLAQGTYYVSLTGCNYTALPVKPTIWIVPEGGDVCGRPVTVTVNANNASYEKSSSIDCHTWSADFGEKGFTNTGCFFEGSPTSYPRAQKHADSVKSTWFKFQVGSIGGKADMRFEFNYQNTSQSFVGAGDIKYRVLYGTCGAMRAGECQNSINQYFQLDCMPDKTDYYIQVVSPAKALGIVSVKLVVKQPANLLCTPQDVDPLRVQFDLVNSCKGQDLQTVNLSSQGEFISYEWTVNGQTMPSTSLNPVFSAQNTSSVSIKLAVKNSLTDKVVSLTKVFSLFDAPLTNWAVAHDNGSVLQFPVENNLSFYANASNTSQDPPTSFEWDFGNDSLYAQANQMNPVNIKYRPKDIGIFNVKLKSISGSCYFEDQKEVITIGTLARKVTKCTGSSISLDGGTPEDDGVTYEWFKGSSTNIMSTARRISTVDADLYTVKRKLTSGAQQIFLFEVVNLNLPALSLGADVQICEGEPAILRPVTINKSDIVEYLWATGGKGDQLAVSAQGKYWLEVRDKNNCIGRDTVKVSYRTSVPFSLGKDVHVCKDGVVTLSTGFSNSGGYSHYWSTGETAETITTSVHGSYWVKVTSPMGCSSFDTVKVSTSNQIPVALGSGKKLCGSEETVLQSSYTYPNASYSWYKDDVFVSSTSTFSTKTAGIYKLKISQGAGCSGVGAVEVKTPHQVPVNLGQNVAMCQGETAVLNAFVQGASYLWSTTPPATTPQLSVSVPGVYRVVARHPDLCDGTSQVTVTLMPSQPINLGADKFICKDTQVTLDAGVDLDNYLWSNGAVTRTITVGEGSYSVSGTRSGICFISENILVNRFADQFFVNLGADTIHCTGQPLTLNVSKAGLQYSWSTGSTAQAIEVNQSGTYNVRVTDQHGCITSDEIVASVKPLFDPLVIGPSEICNEITGVFRVENAEPQWTFAWVDGSTKPRLDVTQPGTYSVTITDHATGCVATKQMEVVRNDVCEPCRDVQIYPNPYVESKALRLVFPEKCAIPSRLILTLYEGSGKQIPLTADRYSDREYVLYLPSLSSGQYYVRIKLDKGVVTLKLQVL